MDCIHRFLRAFDGGSGMKYRDSYMYTKMKTKFRFCIPQITTGSWDGIRTFQEQNFTNQPIMIWKSHHGLMLQPGKRKYLFKLSNEETRVKGKMPAVQDTARTIGVIRKVLGYQTLYIKTLYKDAVYKIMIAYSWCNFRCFYRVSNVIQTP